MSNIDIIALILGLSQLVFAGAAFYLLNFMPSRQEFQAHETRDNERFDTIRDMLKEMKADLLREFKNGSSR